ncbi:hypothetical protein [Gordonia sp. (in: high G+C Gram-positive bacteria)]|uniref:hypothetical protein n=1 Tax=Gordonia sp. (in: high G+C Gram-positive bacteria) TaxID=84139 RepID=UPI003C744CE7
MPDSAGAVRASGIRCKVTIPRVRWGRVMTGDRPSAARDVVRTDRDRRGAPGLDSPAADLTLGWWTLRDRDGVLEPESFLTRKRALDRATLHPLWYPIRWQIYGPDGRLNLTRKD